MYFLSIWIALRNSLEVYLYSRRNVKELFFKGQISTILNQRRKSMLVLMSVKELYFLINLL